MSFLRDLLALVQTLGSAVAGFVRAAAGKLAEIWGTLCAGALGKIPEEKRRPFLIGVGGGCALVALALTGFALLMNKNEAAPSAGQGAPARRVEIPPEELFLPDEPDFVPGVLLERERRTAWTVEDAAPFWQDPLKYGEEPWRARLEATVDELLERVP
jgi:hypothetical protein